jgi:hypothetical protein
MFHQFLLDRFDEVVRDLTDLGYPHSLLANFVPCRSRTV